MNEINETPQENNNNKKAGNSRPGKGPFDQLEHILNDLWRHD